MVRVLILDVNSFPLGSDIKLAGYLFDCRNSDRQAIRLGFKAKQ